MVNQPGLPVPKSSTRISTFYAPTDSEHKFNKTEIKNWLPWDAIWNHLDWEPIVITTALCLSANRESLIFTETMKKSQILKLNLTEQTEPYFNYLFLTKLCFCLFSKQ